MLDNHWATPALALGLTVVVGGLGTTAYAAGTTHRSGAAPTTVTIKAQGVDLTIGFRLLGNPSGEVDRYVVRVRDGVVHVESGHAAQDGEARDATVTCQGYDYLKLATGHLNPVLGVLTGTLKVKGDKAKALRLSSIIDIPRAR